MSLWPIQQPNLICLYKLFEETNFSIKSGKSIPTVPVLFIIKKIQNIFAHCLCSFRPWCHGGQKVRSCGWQKAETVVPTMGCQDSVSQPDSSSTQAGHSSQRHLRRPAMETGRKGNGEAEGPRPGLDCTECSDKTTGKGRPGQGNRGSWLGLVLPQEDLTHPSDHLPHLWRPALSHAHRATSQKLGIGHQSLRLDSTSN